MTQRMPANLRKAAVLICSLNADSADELLEQMSEQQAERVRAAIMDLGDVEEAEQRTVIAEFLRGGASERPGGAMADLPAEETETPWEEAGQPIPIRQPDSIPGIATPERPRVQPPPDRELEPSAPPACDLRLFDFEDLAGLDDRGLALLLQSVDPEITLLALAGAGQGMVRRVLQPLNFRQSRALQRRMARMGPMRLTDIDGAQQRMVRTAERLMADGHVRRPAEIANLPGDHNGEDH